MFFIWLSIKIILDSLPTFKSQTDLLDTVSLTGNSWKNVGYVLTLNLYV